MIDGLRPYPQMKPSGLPSLGDIPAHWEVRRNGRLFGARRETDFPDLPILEVSIRSGVRVRNFGDGGRKQEMADRSKYQRAVQGDIAYNMMRMWQGAVGIVPADGLVSPAYVVARPFPETDSAYYAYLFRTAAYMREIDAFSRGIVPDRNRLYWEAFKQMPSVYPPLDEQRLIVRFLDWHGARTAKLIRAKKKLIGLLNEQKRAIIQQAVTRGLISNVVLQPSGTPYVGDIPRHWNVVRLKNLVSQIDQGISPQAENRLAEGEDWGVLKAGCINGGVFRELQHKRLPEGLEFDENLRVRLGDVLISRASGSPTLVGSAGKVTALSRKLILSDKIFRPIFRNEMDADFMFFVMNSHYFRRQVELAISGAEGLANNLPLTSLKEFRIVLPPRDEMEAIVNYLDDALENDGLLQEVVQNGVDSINKYHTKIVMDVVTGNLDVQEAAALLTVGMDSSDVLEAETTATDEEFAEDELAEADA